MDKAHLTKRTTKASRFLLIAVLLGLSVGAIPHPTARAATPGLPFTEDFADDTLRDASLTNANWSTDEQALALAWRRAQYGPFGPGLTGTSVSSDAHLTTSVALGDVDGDGDLDVVVGNSGQVNRLYRNKGTANPFSGVVPLDISADAHGTYSVALGDVDGDGDLDLVAGNWGQVNRLYLNNGTTNPFSGAIGSDISTDTHYTLSVALGDVDGDGDLDLVAGNWNQANRLYLNDGVGDPFDTLGGSDVSADAHATTSVALGNVDGDGDLDLVAGNQSQANRLYLNNGTASPFSGVTGSDVTTDAHYTESVALGDVDGDGDLDMVAGNAGSANRLYLNDGVGDPFDTLGGSDVSTDVRSTNSVALGDVDGDGDLDLVAGNYNSQPNRLYLNDGTSSPFSGAIGSDVTTDAHDTTSVALGDVDGDGDLDLVAGNYDQYNRLYLNAPSDSPFTGASGSDVSGDTHDTRSVALGDVDRDGDLDLVVGNYGQVNRLYLNSGGGTFTGSNVTTDAHDTASVALGDVDRDGDLDLIAGNYNQANRLYLNNGSGTFGAGSNITTDAHNTTSVALGDMDGDGDLDLVVGNYVEANRLYLNDGVGNPFDTLGSSTVSADTHATRSVALGDVDRDGDLDVVAGNWNQVNRLYRNGGSSVFFKTDVSSDVHYTWSVALGDVDGDGDLDLVAGNGAGQPNRLYPNDGAGDPFDTLGGSNVSNDTHDTLSVALGDVDEDGDLDVIAGNYNQANRLVLNNGTATPFSGVTGSDVSGDAHNTRSVVLGDVSGDGDLDLVAGNDGEVNRLVPNGDTPSPTSGWVGSDASADTHWTKSVALGDVDGDGDLDLLVGNWAQANRLYLNDGSGTFSAGSDVSTDTRATTSVALGDVDGDGDLDLVTGNSGRNRLYLNDGSGTFGAGSDVSTDNHGTGSVALGDMDGDGDLDLVAGNYGNQANRLYLNDGVGDPFDTLGGSDVSADAHSTYSVALGDVDGDGDLDMVAGNYDQANRLYLNDGSGTFGAGSDVSTDTHDTTSVVLGDVDGDGDLDLVAGNASQANRLYLNDGVGDPFDTLGGSDVSTDTHVTGSVALRDVDGDGDLDLVAGNSGGQTNRLYLNNGTASPFSGVTGSDVSADAHYTQSVVLGDVDGDGDLDMVAGNYDQANRLYRRMLYHTGQGRAASLTVDTESGNIDQATLIPSANLPPNTGVTYWLSNNGGTTWFIVQPGVMFVFPTAGSDLRWRAELHSLSPVRTPHIDQIRITDQYHVYLPLVLKDSP